MPTKVTVEYDVDEICPSCSQIPRILFAFELHKLPNLAKYVEKMLRIVFFAAAT